MQQTYQEGVTMSEEHRTIETLMVEQDDGSFVSAVQLPKGVVVSFVFDPDTETATITYIEENNP
jgi:hypothetical protein